MPYKLKPESVPNISIEIANPIIEKTFAQIEKVDGEKLISLTNSRQINSFLIRSLFNQWRKEVEHLESPYFDFKHERVKDALKQFMNVLSNHISIDKAHLRPLLERAIADTFYISFEPSQYLNEVLNRSDKPQDLKRELKYIKTNRDFFKMLIDQVDEFSTHASIQEDFKKLDTGLKESIDAEELMNKLNAKGHLETLFSFQALEKSPIPIEKAEEQPNPIPKGEDGTVNDRFQGSERGITLAEKLQQKMKKSIESGLTLNEKFMFQNALFGGDAAIMKEALRTLDQANTLNEALDQANTFNQGWDMESEEVEALMNLLENRFK